MSRPAATAPNRPTAWIAAAVLAVVVLALVTLILVDGGSGDDDVPGQSAASTARAACELIDQVPEEGFDIGDEANLPHQSRLGAAETLAFLAKDLDSDYESLYEAVRAPRNIAAAEFDWSSDDVVNALADARAACDERN